MATTVALPESIDLIPEQHFINDLNGRFMFDVPFNGGSTCIVYMVLKNGVMLFLHFLTFLVSHGPLSLLHFLSSASSVVSDFHSVVAQPSDGNLSASGSVIFFRM